MTEDPCIEKLRAEINRMEREALLAAEMQLLDHGATRDEVTTFLVGYRQRLATWRATELPKAEAWVRRRGAGLH